MDTETIESITFQPDAGWWVAQAWYDSKETVRTGHEVIPVIGWQTTVSSYGEGAHKYAEHEPICWAADGTVPFEELDSYFAGAFALVAPGHEPDWAALDAKAKQMHTRWKVEAKQAKAARKTRNIADEREARKAAQS